MVVTNFDIECVAARPAKADTPLVVDTDLKTGKARAIRFSTLDAICRYLNCQPGDLLEYRETERPP